MAYCMCCGSQIPDEAAFCPVCGAAVQNRQVNPAGQGNMAPQQGQSGALYPQGNMAPQQGQSGALYPQGGYMPAPNVPKESHTGLIIGIISSLVVLAVLAVVLFAWPGVLRKNDEGETVARSTAKQPVQITEEDSTLKTEEEAEPVTDIKTEAEPDTEIKTEEETEPVTEEKTEKETEPETEEKTEAQTTEKDTQAATEKAEKVNFDDYGIKLNLKQNKPVRIATGSRDDESREVYATVTWADYYSEPVSDNTIQFGKDNQMDLSGYEVKEAIVEIVYEDSENFRTFGGQMRGWVTDWYNIDLFESTLEELTDNYDTTYKRAKILVNGKEKYAYVYFHSTYDEQTRSMVITVTALVPKGYDGIVVGVVDSRVKMMDKTTRIYDVYDKNKFLLFYLK